MKLLWIPYGFNNPDDSQFGDLLRAFNKKFETELYNGTWSGFDPDVIHFQEGALHPDVIKELKEQTQAKVIVYTGDIRYTPHDSLTPYKEVADEFYLPVTDTEGIYEKLLGKPCRYMFEQIQDWKFMEPKKVDNRDIIFVGNNYGHLSGRGKVIEFLKQFCPNFKLYGDGWGNSQRIDFKDAMKLYNDSFAVICENNCWGNPGSIAPCRNLMAMTHGSCAIMRSMEYPNFHNLENCMMYRNKYELLDVILYLQKNSELRDQIAINGYKTAKDKYSCDAYAERFNYLNQ